MENPSDNSGLAIKSYTIKRKITINSGIYISIKTITSSTYAFSYFDTSPISPTQKYIILCTYNIGDTEESDEINTYIGIKPEKVINLFATSINSTSITFKYDEPNNIIEHYYNISSSTISSYTDSPDDPYDNNLNLFNTLDNIT